MSWPNYPAVFPEEEEEGFPYLEQFPAATAQGIQQQYAAYPSQYHTTSPTLQQIYHQQPYLPMQQQQQQQQQQPQYYPQQVPEQTQWPQIAFPPAHAYPTQGTAPVPQYVNASQYTPAVATADPPGYLPLPTARPRISRVASERSEASSEDDASRNVSSNADEMAKWGNQNLDGTWSCKHPKCASSSTFTRGCDLRKHYKRHAKNIFCRYEDCPQSRKNGFSSNKDRDRHETSHNPSIPCSIGCGKVFSREDNMRDHARRIHGIVRGSGHSA